MTTWSDEEVELLLQIARDCTIADSFEDRMTAITDALQTLIPAASLSVVVIGEPDAMPRPLALFRRNEVENLLAYANHYRHADPMGYEIAQATGRPLLLTECVEQAEYGRDAFTGEFLPRLKLRYVMGVCHRMPDDLRLALALQRESSQGDFTERERGALRFVSADIARAAAGALMREKLQEMARKQAADSAARCGAMLFDPSGALVHADPGALTIASELESTAALEALAADARQLAQRPLEGTVRERLLRLAGGGLVRARTSPLESRPGTRVLTVLERPRPGTKELFRSIADEAKLTPRQREIAELAVEGHGNRGIGYKLGISPVTVSVQLTRIYRKVGVASRTELARVMSGGA